MSVATTGSTTDSPIRLKSGELSECRGVLHRRLMAPQITLEASGQRQDEPSYLVDFICDYWLENPGPPQLDVLRAAAAVVPDSQGCCSRTRRPGLEPDLDRAACVSRQA